MPVKLNYFQLIGFVTQLAGIIATIDSNSDKKVDGAEKLAAAKRAAQALFQSFPNLQGSMDPIKLDKAINLFVDLLNLFVKP